jgi:hypothetical protein
MFNMEGLLGGKLLVDLRSIVLNYLLVGSSVKIGKD